MKIKRENADIIIALASDQSLVNICRFKNDVDAKWGNPQEDTYCFNLNYMYRLTTKENMEAAIHYLNGGAIQKYREGHSEGWETVISLHGVDFTKNRYRLKQKQEYVKYKNDPSRAALDLENNVDFFRNEELLTSMPCFLEAFLNDELQVKKD